MNKLESILTCVIFALLIGLLGCGSYIYDLNQEILEQRVSLFESCVQDYGVRNCHF